MWTVTVVECERGWGQRIDEVREFDNFIEAKAFSDKVNSHNTDRIVPDWYMMAYPPEYKEV